MLHMRLDDDTRLVEYQRRRRGRAYCVVCCARLNLDVTTWAADLSFEEIMGDGALQA